MAAQAPRFTAIIDAGSSGSRLYVFELTDRNGVASLDGRPVGKVTPGLSSFADDPERAAEYLMPLFHAAQQLIPEEEHRNTHIFIKSTAGMRLLTEATQKVVYDKIFEDLSQPSSGVRFRLKRKHIGTIDGAMEAYYAVLSTNYLEGRIDALLQPTGHHGGVLGALDMGGASTQIIFSSLGVVEEDNKIMSPELFWGNSFLSFGVATIRDRVWEHLVITHTTAGKSQDAMVENPCAFVGHIDEWQGFLLIGVGSSSLCRDTLKHVIWGDEHIHCIEGSCSIDGVHVPDVVGDFFAMSVFFYGLDCVRELGLISGTGGGLHAVWPRPSVGELVTAVDEFCSMDWQMMNETMLNAHPFTQPEWLQYRCLEAVYMVTLLRDGYGFPVESRNITFALEANGMEVEWTLGFALTHTAQKAAAARAAAVAEAIGGGLGEAALVTSVEVKLNHQTSFAALGREEKEYCLVHSSYWGRSNILASSGTLESDVVVRFSVIVSLYALCAVLSWRRGWRRS